MKVDLSGEAEAQVQQIDAWWRENRQAAPDLFANELEQALLALEETPAQAGPPVGARATTVRAAVSETVLPPETLWSPERPSCMKGRWRAGT